MKHDVIGKFRYREPAVQQTARAKSHYPVVTVYGDQALQPLFGYLQQVINSRVVLKTNKEHEVLVEHVDGRLRLTFDGKKILMLEIPK